MLGRKACFGLKIGKAEWIMVLYEHRYEHSIPKLYRISFIIQFLCFLFLINITIQVKRNSRMLINAKNMKWILAFTTVWEPLRIWCRVWERYWDRPSAECLTKATGSLPIFNKPGSIIFLVYSNLQRVTVADTSGGGDNISQKEGSVLFRRQRGITISLTCDSNTCSALYARTVHVCLTQNLSSLSKLHHWSTFHYYWNVKPFLF